ncbi:AraC family transcriptional regulator [Pseudoflavitalea sp. X16]|uniref:AraC family transcriptional regulator n=1 Tax=Paraflavitalea devenefica TaxID=2716334 RepID=UPI00142300BC|nr:AraC family transcriptional regulator [Paraflavitalea devenefica]NII26603.1 AraC family transcriptional regulator [Paraflavitalea devenefica]
MKPHLMKIHLEAEHSFSVRHDIAPHFYNHWHYHPELELVHIIKGYGRQFIGDHIHHFKANDMILLGADLPHLWRSDEKFLRKNSTLQMEAIIVHFTPGCLGADFFKLPENKDLLKLFDKAQQGVRIKNQTRIAVAGLMQQLVAARKSERIILLMQILHAIASSKQTKTVCSKGFEFHYNEVEADRMNNIYQYIMKNFSREITLEQIAKVAHISPNSFCRYFKSRIKKTFSRFLMEVRIGHACKLLAETHKTIAEVCYESGFNNFSNFNRHFKAITGKTPMAHRKHYQEMK